MGELSGSGVRTAVRLLALPALPALLLAAAGPALAALPLPDFITKCPSPEPANLSACVVDTAQRVLPFMVKGIRRYSLPSLDPMRVDKIAFNRGSLSIAFTDMQIIGGRHAVFTGADVNLKEGRLTLNFSFPEIELVSKYAIDGRVLVVPLTGKGDCRLVFYKVNATYEMKQGIYTKDDGLEYLKIVNPKFSFTVENISVTLENLFNGDKTLGKFMNQFINDNWRELFEEIKEGAFQAMNSIITSTMQGVSNNVPYRDIYPVEPTGAPLAATQRPSAAPDRTN